MGNQEYYASSMIRQQQSHVERASKEAWKFQHLHPPVGLRDKFTAWWMKVRPESNVKKRSYLSEL